MVIQKFQNGSMASMYIKRTMVFPSHILFADDVLLFCKASIANARSIMEILDSYAELYNQIHNTDKSRLYFYPHAPLNLRRRIVNRLHITEGNFPFFCLLVLQRDFYYNR